MLKKENRLKKRIAFAATYKTGKVVHGDGITIFLGREKTNDSPTKIGFVVSKKIHKRAVKRNRIKRLMRESIRLLIKEGSMPNKHISLIFVASTKLLGRSFNQINTSMKTLVSRL